VLENSPKILDLLQQLQQRHSLLPTIIFATPVKSDASIHATDDTPESMSPPATSSSTAPADRARETIPPSPESKDFSGSQDPAIPDLEQLKASYHSALLWVEQFDHEQIDQQIRQAIDQFLTLPASQLLPQHHSIVGLNQQTSLVLQQRRLASKLKERLGYLGVYYKRNPRYFLRNMSDEERHEFLEDLSLKYREIILNYFSNNDTLNQRIDEYINMAFFADVSVSQIVEIHMELMDEFSKQLQLEGRSEEILLDYRLTLIDVIAHLCEMYRRSIPRES
jgi:circadian clock protein KaiA